MNNVFERKRGCSSNRHSFPIQFLYFPFSSLVFSYINQALEIISATREGSKKYFYIFTIQSRLKFPIQLYFILTLQFRLTNSTFLFYIRAQPFRDLAFYIQILYLLHFQEIITTIETYQDQKKRLCTRL